MKRAAGKRPSRTNLASSSSSSILLLARMAAALLALLVRSQKVATTTASAFTTTTARAYTHWGFRVQQWKRIGTAGTTTTCFSSDRRRLINVSSSSLDEEEESRRIRANKNGTVKAVQQQQSPISRNHQAEEMKLVVDHPPSAPPNGAAEKPPWSPAAIERLTQSWREHPACNPTIHFKSWQVPERKIQTVLRSKLTQPYLANEYEITKHLRTRLRVVRNIANNSNNNKLILLHPDTPALSDLPANVRDILLQQNDDSDECACCCCCRDGPEIPVSLAYHQFTAAFVLQQLLPIPPPAAFETVGHVAHLNLRSHHLPYKQLIGEVILETLQPAIQTVIQKVGEVTGPFRTYNYEVLAGRPDTAVDLMENGVSLQFDLSQVYWCSRLSEERQRLVKNEILKQQQQQNDTVILADVFCGVGALCLQAAITTANCEIWANDWNPNAVAALKANAARNGVADKFTSVECCDGYDFLMDLGISKPRLPDHVVMNFPLEAPQFLGALRWWPAAADDSGVVPRVHVYTFARAANEDEDDDHRTEQDVAVDKVANNLLPVMGNVKWRLAELNDDYGCNVKVHTVRDVAPGKVVLCVSFSATAKLLKHMQGDFS